MQVMPNTQRNPGYGVRPAQDNSSAELERVGVDYFNAMKSKYKDDTLAAIAYNMGPNKTDAWIKAGGNFKDLPKETQEYIPKVYLAQAKIGQQGGAPVTTTTAEQAPRSASRGRVPSLAEVEVELGARKEGLEEEFKKRGASLAESAITIEDAASSAPDTLATAKYIDKIATENPRIFGILQQPTVAAAFAKLVEKGISAGNTSISLSGLSDAIRRASPGVTKDELVAVEKASQQLAKLKLTAARTYLKGQGAVSNFERDIIADFTGSADNSVEALKDFMAWNTMRATYDQRVGKIYKDWQRANRNKSFQDFQLDSKEYENATNEYRTQIGEFGERGGMNYKVPGSSPAASGQTSGKVKWSVVE
jgi:soluble lytic murein transglycosylase-like protein